MLIRRLHFLYGNLKNMSSKYYAVAKGRKPGIYNTWAECNVQINQFAGAVFKKFNSQIEAKDFIKEYSKPNQKCFYKTTAPILGKRSYSQSSSSSAIGNAKILSKKQKNSTVGQSTKTICVEKKKTSEGYIMDNDGYVNVYTDGACSANGGKNARAGIGVWFGDGHPLNVSEAVVGRATNNMAEIQAVSVAAKQAKKAGIKKLKVNTDSQFLISCINNWMPRWKTNGWKTATNKPVINKVELLEMEEALKSLDISWNHVNGHVGIYGNEMADALARAGCLKY